MAIFINYKNFKCEDCGGDKFTVIDKFKEDRNEFTINCATKDCEASYDFRPVMKLSSSSHPPKVCKCGKGFLSRDTKFCSGCGIKNPNYKNPETPNNNKITDKDLDIDDDEVDELLTKGMKSNKNETKTKTSI